jgi:hypothetical protein
VWHTSHPVHMSFLFDKIRTYVFLKSECIARNRLYKRRMLQSDACDADSYALSCKAAMEDWVSTTGGLPVGGCWQSLPTREFSRESP